MQSSLADLGAPPVVLASLGYIVLVGRVVIADLIRNP
jgi:hypothetical protein